MNKDKFKDKTKNFKPEELLFAELLREIALNLGRIANGR